MTARLARMAPYIMGETLAVEFTGRPEAGPGAVTFEINGEDVQVAVQRM
jgi:hypothetical protein